MPTPTDIVVTEKPVVRTDVVPTRASRPVVFLNHANPEDNAFVRWLGARLSAAGYTVWCDLLQLVGGERFWKDINEAIRRHTAIFLPILSTASVNPAKEGVHNEIAIATAVRREHKLENFIVPLRLEPVPEVPAQLIQLNYIDFSVNWADGLAQLLDRLAKSKIPRRSSPEQPAMLAWAASHTALSGAVLKQSEILQSNWFPIQNLPSQINFYGSPVPKDLWERTIDTLSIPCRPLLRLMVSFATFDTVQLALGPDVPVTLEYSVLTQDFLTGAPHDGPRVKASDARNIVTDILRQAWETFAAAHGLQSHEMAHGTCWYVPLGLLEKDKVKFRDADGKAKWRAMIGIRGKRRIRWHYAISVRPMLTDPFRLLVRSHAVFSEDTKTLITDDKRALRLRKWLCKSWWNDDFRDRLLGLITHLSGGESTLSLPLGTDVVAVVGSFPLRFLSPLAYIRHNAEGEPDTPADDEPEDETLARADHVADDSDEDDEDDDLGDEEIDEGAQEP